MAKKKGEKTATVSKKVQEKLEDGWEHVSGQGIIKWEKGMYIEGSIIDVRKAGKGMVMDFREVTTGVQTYGCPTFLQNIVKMLDAKDYIRISCLGKVHTKNGDAWDFSVIRKKN